MTWESMGLSIGKSYPDENPPRFCHICREELKEVDLSSRPIRYDIHSGEKLPPLYERELACPNAVALNNHTRYGLYRSTYSYSKKWWKFWQEEV